MDIIKRVSGYIYENNLIEEGDKVVVGVSGGPDSMCLLHLLYRLSEGINISLVVAHINHMLRGEEANEDESYVQNFCSERNIQFFSKRVDVNKLAKEKKMSTETIGRNVRYDFFKEVMVKTNANKVATAHNANDQVETIFMRIIRGTGLEGLVGIPVKRDEIYIRPILFLQREEIESYCDEYKLNPRIDKSNLEREYSRNKIRLDIIPYIKENFNSDVIVAINRMCQTLKEDNELIEEIVDEYFLKYCLNIEEEIVIKNEIVNCKEVIINRVIRKAVAMFCGSSYNLELKHIKDVKKLLYLGTNKKIYLPNGIYAENIYGDIHIKKIKKIKDEVVKEINILKECIEGDYNFGNYLINFEIINNEKNINFNNNKFIKYFNYDKINGNIIIRNRKNGDKMIPLGMTGSKKLKDIFINSKVSVDDRNNIPIIEFGKEIAWLVGIKVSNVYKVTKEANKLLKITVMERN